MYKKCKYCNNISAKNRNECNTCKNRKYAKKNPLKYSYNSLKSNSKRRGKSFNLTFEQFKKFCIETEYLNKKGIYKNSYHIDRIDESKGYSIDNIQLLTNTKNVKKYVEWCYKDIDNKDVFITKTIKNKEVKIQNCPF